MTIGALVATFIIEIIVALRSRRFGLRQYLIIFLLTLVQLAILVLYLYFVKPPTLT